MFCSYICDHINYMKNFSLDILLFRAISVVTNLSTSGILAVTNLKCMKRGMKYFAVKNVTTQPSIKQGYKSTYRMSMSNKLDFSILPRKHQAIRMQERNHYLPMEEVIQMTPFSVLSVISRLSQYHTSKDTRMSI